MAKVRFITNPAADAATKHYCKFLISAPGQQPITFIPSVSGGIVRFESFSWRTEIAVTDAANGTTYHGASSYGRTLCKERASHSAIDCVFNRKGEPLRLEATTINGNDTEFKGEYTLIGSRQYRAVIWKGVTAICARDWDEGSVDDPYVFYYFKNTHRCYTDPCLELTELLGKTVTDEYIPLPHPLILPTPAIISQSKSLKDLALSEASEFKDCFACLPKRLGNF